ncbi:MAG: ABC transporter substrate-binding protein [Acidimicrobiia bacterium]|nr:ABC transporter substrate-binding protein [Acidimicrobiia bacterium]
MRILGVIAVLALVAAACSPVADPTTTTAEPPPPTTTQPPDVTSTTMGPMVWEPLYEGTLVLGRVLPETGALAVIGPAVIKPIEMAIAEAAEAGNTNIELIAKDSGTDPQIATVAVDELLNEGVHAILGPASTGVSLSVIDRITGAGVPMCSPSNTGAIFTTYDDNGFYFRTAPPDNLQAQVHADLIAANGHSSVAVAYRSDEYGRGLGLAIAGNLENLGIDVPVVIEFDKDGTSFDAEAAQIAAAGVDAISLHPFAEGNAFMQSLIEAGLGPQDVQIYGGDGFLDNVSAETVDPGNPGLFEGIRGTYPSLAPPDGEPTFVSRFNAFAPDVPTIFSSHSYDCAMIMILAAESAGSTDPAAIAAAINDVTRGGTKCSFYADCHALLQAGEDIDYDGASGPLDFVDAGEPGAGTYDLVLYGADGSYSAQETVSIP